MDPGWGSTHRDWQCCMGGALDAQTQMRCQTVGFIPGNANCQVMHQMLAPVTANPLTTARLQAAAAPQFGVVLMAPRAGVTQMVRNPQGGFIRRDVLSSPRYVLQSRSPMTIPSAPYRPLSVVPPRQVLTTPMSQQQFQALAPGAARLDAARGGYLNTPFTGDCGYGCGCGC